ncbi:MAG: hypothetical protein DMG36_01360 [Acidobacteria bacterium]|nr:MAG: hypothetical protein DMG36_01360 [Acidobacteriota bacterium]
MRWSSRRMVPKTSRQNRATLTRADSNALAAALADVVNSWSRKVTKWSVKAFLSLKKLGGRIVVDKTGLTGDYDFTLQLAAEGSQAAISTALEEQLGVKLEPQKAPMEVLVIDHAEKP